MIEQRSAEWFEQRVGKITGSRAAQALNISPFGNAKSLMRDMVREYHGAERENQPPEFIVGYGTNNEPMAIIDFEMETGAKVEETGFHVHPEHEWLGASPDGLLGESDVIEIKCPYSLRNGGEFKSIHEQPHYYAQIQLEMACTGRIGCYFFQWSPHDTSLEYVALDQGWLNENLPKLQAFHEKYLAEIKSPDKHLMPVVKTREAQKLADEYQGAKEAMEEAKERLDNAKAALIKCADGHKSNISGVLVYPIERKGNIAYAKVVKEHCKGVDLEPYRGESSTTWRVK